MGVGLPLDAVPVSSAFLRAFWSLFSQVCRFCEHFGSTVFYGVFGELFLVTRVFCLVFVVSASVCRRYLNWLVAVV